MGEIGELGCRERASWASHCCSGVWIAGSWWVKAFRWQNKDLANRQSNLVVSVQGSFLEPWGN